MSEPFRGNRLSEVRALLTRLSAQEKEAVIRELSGTGAPSIPQFVWNSNPLAFKAALRFVRAKATLTRRDVRDHLRSLGLVRDSSNALNFGILYDETGVFAVAPDARGDRGEDSVSLTPIGLELAKLFDDEPRLSPLETVICRGLQNQGGGYSLLSIVSTNPGMDALALRKHMVELYGPKGKFMTGYYCALFKRLGLLTTRKNGRRESYYPGFPAYWGDAGMSEVEQAEAETHDDAQAEEAGV